MANVRLAVSKQSGHQPTANAALVAAAKSRATVMAASERRPFRMRFRDQAKWLRYTVFQLGYSMGSDRHVCADVISS